jgi:hypothetical protein
MAQVLPLNISRVSLRWPVWLQTAGVGFLASAALCHTLLGFDKGAQLVLSVWHPLSLDSVSYTPYTPLFLRTLTKDVPFVG